MKTKLCRYTPTPDGEEQHTISQYRLSPALTVFLQRRKRSLFFWLPPDEEVGLHVRAIIYEKHITLNDRITASTENAHTQRKLERPPEATARSHPHLSSHSMRGKMGSMWGK